MASAPLSPGSDAAGWPAGQGTAWGLDQLAGIKHIPPSPQDRQQIRALAAQHAAALEPGRPLGRSTLETHGRALLAELGLPECYLGFTMVALASAYWREQVEAVPFDRRLLLLPHCLRKAETCPAEYDEFGLLCRSCGACRLNDLKRQAESLGYQVLIAEGSPIVLKMIVQGQADAILGAACLTSLEKALEKVLQVGIPCMAVPLLTNGCRNTTIDVDCVAEMIATPYRPGAAAGAPFLPLLRAASRLFEPEELARLLEPAWARRVVPASEPQPAPGALSAGDPRLATHALAWDFLLRGGKHFRPFITLAAYQAQRGIDPGDIPDAVRRVAVAIEVFHKASLVHDDIEDDDSERYGRPALHRQYGPAAAINVGDYLIGLGYRLVAAEQGALGAAAVSDVLATLSEAHLRLCEGQGAELAWRAAPHFSLPPLEVLRIYALKTAPAFEAALWAGLRLAHSAPALRALTARYSRHLGVAYQILDDLDDWRGGGPVEHVSAGNRPDSRPTILTALAMQNLAPARQQELQRLLAIPEDGDSRRLWAIRALLEQAHVFHQASALVDKHRRRAHALADEAKAPSLVRLLHYLVDAILA